MAIELSSSTVRAGETLHGIATDDDGRPAERELELTQGEAGVKTNQRVKSSKLTTRSHATTGEFSFRIPKDAAPTISGQRVRIQWLVRANRGTLRSDDRTTVRVLPSASVDLNRLPVSYEPGASPNMIKGLRHEHYLSMFMGFAFVSMWLAGAIAINVMESEASAQATRVATIIAVVVALFPLAALYLATRTVWPKRVSGFEPRIQPALARPGETITLTSEDPWPDDLRFLCVETYNRTYGPGPSHTRHRRSQFETFEHSEQALRSDSGHCTFRIPDGAASSYDGDQAQIRWVVRRGGRKILRWGPIRLTEWGIVVTHDES